MSTLVHRSYRIPARARVVLVLAVALLAVFAVAFDQSYLLTGTAHADNVVHEFFHDARHLLGVPCH
ncbi:MAG: CbtB-domain containing protein [Mycobacteriales bacterium]